MSKEQTPITAEEFYLNNRGDLLRSNLGTKEFTIDMMEQYANAKVLEALEREVPKAYGVGYYDRVLNSGDTNRKYKDRQEYYETGVKPKYKQINK